MKRIENKRVLVGRMAGALVMALMLLMSPQIARADVWDNAMQVKVCPYVHIDDQSKDYRTSMDIEGKMMIFKNRYSEYKSSVEVEGKNQARIDSRSDSQEGYTVLLKTGDNKGYIKFLPFLSQFYFMPGEFSENNTVFTLPVGFVDSEYGGSGNTWSQMYRYSPCPMLVTGDSIKCLDDIKEISFKVSENGLELIRPAELQENGQFALGYMNISDYSSYDRPEGNSRVTSRYFYAAANSKIEQDLYYPFGVEMQYKLLHFITKPEYEYEFVRDFVAVKVGVRDDKYYMMMPNNANDISKGCDILIGNIEGNTVRFKEFQYIALGMDLTEPTKEFCDYGSSSILATVDYDYSDTSSYYVSITLADEDLIFNYDPNTLNLTNANKGFARGSWIIIKGSEKIRSTKGYYLRPQVWDFDDPNGNVGEIESEDLLRIDGTMASVGREARIEVYSIEGKLVAATTGIRLDLSSLGHGIFIIKANSQTRKIAL